MVYEKVSESDVVSGFEVDSTESIWYKDVAVHVIIEQF